MSCKTHELYVEDAITGAATKMQEIELTKYLLLPLLELTMPLLILSLFHLAQGCSAHQQGIY